MKKLALIALPLVLASCTMAGPTEANYTLAPQAVVKQVGPAYAPAGTAQVNEALGVTRTSITLTGMAPYAIYVAHYHKPGAAPAGTTGATTTTATTAAATTTATMAPTASTDVCSTNGPAIMESRMIAQATADGKVTLNGIVATALIRDAAYINVHHGRDFSGALADSGVICTPVTVR